MKSKKDSESPAHALPRCVRPGIDVSPGKFSQAIDSIVPELGRLSTEDIFYHYIRGRLGILIHKRLAECPFTAFQAALDKQFGFSIGNSAVDVPTRFARTLFENPKYWRAITMVMDDAAALAARDARSAAGPKRQRTKAGAA